MLKPSFAKLLTKKGTGKPGSGSSIASRTSSLNSWVTTNEQDSLSDEELFYDASITPDSLTRQEDSRHSINSSTVDDLGDADANWYNCPPPAELLILPTGTSMDIESIIEPSIEALKTRHREERLIRAEYHQQDEQRVKEPCSNDKGKGVERKSGLLSSSHSSTEPKIDEIHQTPDCSNERTAAEQSNWAFWGMAPSKTKARLSGASESTSVSPTDSGYGSGATDASSIDLQPPKSSGIRGLFRRPKDSAKKSTSSVTKQCVSCFDDFDSNRVVDVGCHTYCNECFRALIKTAMGAEEHWPPKCCLNEIPSYKILPQLDAGKRKRYNDLVAERSIPAGDRIYCSKSSCAAWIPPNNIDKSQLRASCPKCRTKSCTSCRGQFHPSGDCPTDPALLATVQLASDEGWRRCYNCHAMVEHNQGCMHMTCTCKAAFCYICGKKWRTCSCGLDGSAYFAGIQVRKAAASARQQAATQAAEQARAAERLAEEEAEELREILLEIEEYETMEAVRLASEDEARRLEAEAERILREEERIQAIMSRFRELNNELDFVHDMQRVALISQHEQQLLALDQETKTWEAAKREHANEVLRAKTEAQATISAAEFWFDVEYQERLTKQRAIEDNYAQQLIAYWGDEDDGQTKIVKCMKRLKEAHADTYRDWYAVQNAEHKETLRRAEAELEDVKNRVSREAAAMDEKRVLRESELRRRAKTDNRWMEMVAAERFNMLQNMEQAEYATLVE